MPYKDKDKAREYSAKYMRNKAKKGTLWVREMKAKSGCSNCGFKHPAALQYHHIDPSTKRGKVSRLCKDLSKKAVLEEIGKCVLLCANCHAIEHDENTNST